MDYLSHITEPIKAELGQFIYLFNESLTHDDGMLGRALQHIRNQGGKRMRPMLILLMAKNLGKVNDRTLDAAVGLELLHTASLVHDDVVDESRERRGQPSVNALYDNKVAVLVGDYVLSTSLLSVSRTGSEVIVREIAQLGQALAKGELLQLTNIQNREISEEVYYQVIRQKTAALFEACAAVGALSVEAKEAEVEAARKFGSDIGMIFQIRDDIFDYSDSREIGKPTGNDMAEGKLTLPVIYALKNNPFEAMTTLAKKVKAGTINTDEIAVLVEYAKKYGGIEYAEQVMQDIAKEARQYIAEHVSNDVLRCSFEAYLEYVIHRNK